MHPPSLNRLNVQAEFRLRKQHDRCRNRYGLISIAAANYSAGTRVLWKNWMRQVPASFSSTADSSQLTSFLPVRPRPIALERHQAY